jgi:hypothetical protein
MLYFFPQMVGKTKDTLPEPPNQCAPELRLWIGGQTATTKTTRPFGSRQAGTIKFTKMKIWLFGSFQSVLFGRPCQCERTGAHRLFAAVPQSIACRP